MILHSSNNLMQLSALQDPNAMSSQSLRCAPDSGLATPNSKSSIVSNKRHGFTLIEIVTALVVLALIVSGSLVVINNCLESTVDIRMRMAAFSLARENMEKLLGASSVTESVEYGDSNDVPGLSWETRIEPFYDPHTTRMWIRGVSSASWSDVTGEQKKIEFTQWLTDLTAADIQKILRREEDQQVALDGETLAQSEELLDKVMQANESVGSDGYKNLVELARQLIETFPNAPAANKAREVLNTVPPAVKQEFSIQPQETTPTKPSLSDSLNKSSDSQTSDNKTTDTANGANDRMIGKYKESYLLELLDKDPKKAMEVIGEILSGK
jgi:prepilin-type N-terminal cleavage/methylation domain-containing protein